MQIALDATYSAGHQLTGIGVYSTELLQGLAASHPEHRFLHCYRPKAWRLAQKPTQSNVRRKLLQYPLPLFGSHMFHALNQRLDHRYSRRHVVTFHDLFVMTAEYSTAAFRERFTRQARLAVANADAIIAVSEFTATQVEQLLGVDRSRIRVVPHGVHLPESFVSDEDRDNIILFVGALQKRKNIERLVEAFEGLPDDWRLVLAGATSGFGAEKILDSIERSTARSRIELTGFVSASDLEALYRRARIFAFPSLDEGFGIPVLEAMARGVPVVTSSMSALQEIADGAAMMAEPCDTASLFNSLSELVGNHEKRRELQRQGRDRAALYPWSRTTNTTWNVYLELTGKATAS